MKINQYLKNEPYGCIQTAIGELCIFGLTVGNSRELDKSLGKPLDKCEPIEYARHLCIYICYPKASLHEGKYKPDKPILSPTDISSLTDADLEAIARFYIEYNEHLFKKDTVGSETNDKGEQILIIGYGDVEYPINEGESYKQYLLRLALQHNEKQKKQFEKSYGTFKNFSSDLETNIKKSLAWGADLKSTIANYRSFGFSNVDRQPSISDTFFEIERRKHENERAKEERQLQPIKDLSKRLDNLIDVSTQSTEFLVEANKLQSQIAGEIKASGADNNDIAKHNAKLSYIVISLTILIPLITFFLNNADSVMQRRLVEKHVDLLSNKLTDINTSIVDQNKVLKAENDRLNKIISNQNKEIHRMKHQTGNPKIQGDIL